MERQQETTQKLNISLTPNGGLNLSATDIDQLSDEEFLLVQQLLDEAKTRTATYHKLQAIANKDAVAQGAIAAIALLTALVLSTFVLTRTVVNLVRSNDAGETIQWDVRGKGI